MEQNKNKISCTEYEIKIRDNARIILATTISMCVCVCTVHQAIVRSINLKRLYGTEKKISETERENGAFGRVEFIEPSLPPTNTGMKKNQSDFINKCLQ